MRIWKRCRKFWGIRQQSLESMQRKGRNSRILMFLAKLGIMNSECVREQAKSRYFPSFDYNSAIMWALLTA